MRFYPEKQKHKEGDIKVVTKFAWLPKALTCKTIVWLEYYSSHLEYTKYHYDEGNYEIYFQWDEVRSELINKE